MGENANSARAVGWLAGVGGSATPGELGAAMGLGHDRQAALTRSLREAGLIGGGKGRVTLTQAGWAQAQADTGPAGGAGAVVDVVARLWEGIGAYAHAAWLRLLCSAMVARHHLAEGRPRGHVGFMAIGETGTGKTSPVELAAHLFGLDAVAVKRFLYTETPGSLLGRRERDGDGWRLVPSEAAGLPLLLLDEFDKADRAAQTMGWAFFQGETTAQHEGHAWPVRPVPVLAANQPETGNRYRLLRQEFRRRCVVLDTGYMRGRGAEIEDMLTRYYRTARPGGLCLDRLRPAARLSDEGLAMLHQARNALTEAGQAEFPGVEALELAALGRLALAGNTDHRAAAYATGLDYLLVTETVPGQVTGGWQLDLAAIRQWLGDQAAAPLAEVLEAARAGRQQATDHARAAVTFKETLSDTLTADIAELAARLRLAAEAIQPRKLAMLDNQAKARAEGTRAVLAKLRKETSQCRSRERLTELADRATRPLAAAAAITTRLAAERDRRERDKQAAIRQRDQDRRDKQAATKARSQYRAQQRTTLKQIREQARELERLYNRTGTGKGASPLGTLASLRGGGRPLLTYRPPAATPGGERLLRAIAGKRPQGTWQVTGSAVAFPGTRHDCPALARWGDNTRTVLTPALAALHQAEDQLCAALNTKPRTTRPALPGPGALPAARLMLPGYRGIAAVMEANGANGRPSA